MQPEQGFSPEDLEIVELPEREALGLINVKGNVIKNSFNQIVKNVRIGKIDIL